MEELPRRRQDRRANTMYIKTGRKRWWDGRYLKCEHKKTAQLLYRRL